MTSRLSFSSAFALVLLAVGCGAPAVMDVDAGSDSGALPTDGGQDAGPRHFGFRASEDFPAPIAYAQAAILPSNGRRYLYVVGGGDAIGTSVTPYSAVTRSEVHGDGTLGPWIDAGDIGDPGTSFPLVGHDMIPLNGEDGTPGLAVAGGFTPMSPLPFVFGGYVQADSSLGAWGRFDPMLTAGQSFGSFDAFESHQLALIGGIDGTTTVDRVMIAAIMNGAMSPTWRPGPSLPEPRFGHASFTFNGEVFLIGGEGDGGPVTDIIRSQRDATMEVTSWTSVGTIDSAPTFGGAFVHAGQVWVLGGLSGGRAAENPTARVLRADIGSDGHMGAFSRVAGGDLPVALAASAVVYDDPYVYMIGGLTGVPLAASTHVIVGTLP
jgi:hypothetical protein